MDTTELLRIRLRRQLIDAPGDAPRSPAEVVRALGALQAQDYPGALWAIGLRCGAGTTVADVERAIEARTIVRTWPMRGTLHFVPAEDVRWMLGLLAPRVLGRWTTRERQLGLDPATFERASSVFRDALAGGRSLTRPAAMTLLEDHRISTAGQRGYHILGRLSMEGLLVVGAMDGKQQTFALLDEWVPPGPAEQDAPPREIALARFAERYLSGHGPATLEDVARWGGVTKADARIGIADVPAGRLERVEVEGVEHWMAAGAADDAARVGDGASAAGDVHLLPGFDEYLIGYSDRLPQLGEHHETYGSTVSANGMLLATVVIGGRVHGVWRRAIKRDRVDVTVRAFRAFNAREQRDIEAAVVRYARFLGRDTAVAFVE